MALANPEIGAAVGILGGTFDPPHFGHLALADAAQRALTLREVHFMPAGNPWQKTRALTDGTHRAAMVRAAIAGHASWRLDEFELRQTGATYTIDTLKLLYEKSPRTALVLLLGADQFLNLPTWRDWQQLTDYAHLAVAGRPGYDLDSAHWALALRAFATPRLAGSNRIAQRAGAIYLIDMPATPVSSTKLRAALNSTSAAHALVPTSVLDYIAKHQLYSSESAT